MMHDNVMSNLLIGSIAAVLLCGCASKARVKEVKLPNGNPGYYIQCNGLDWNFCYDAAKKVCNGKFDSSNRNEYHKEFEGARTTIIERNMIVECKS